MTGHKRKRAAFLKTVFAGIILISLQISLTEFGLVRRVISNQLLDVYLAAKDSNGSDDTSNFTRQENSITEKHQTLPPVPLPSSGHKGFAEVRARSFRGEIDDRDVGTTKIAMKRAKFHPKPEKLADATAYEFIEGARDLAIRRKKQRQKQQQREQQRKKRQKKKNRDKTPLKVPTPVFVPSLPKSGTTTTHKYFDCGGHQSAHLAARTDDKVFKIGKCAQNNVRAGRDVFENCGDYDIWTDTGYVAARYVAGKELPQDNMQCYYPLIDALEETYTSYPNATFLFVVRNTDAWLESIQSYHDGFIMEVWKRCKTQGFPGLDGTLEDFREFYEWHKEMIRTFASEHPSLTYIEVDLESPEAGEHLQEQIGIDASCWGHHNQQKFKRASTEKQEDSSDTDAVEKTSS